MDFINLHRQYHNHAKSAYAEATYKSKWFQRFLFIGRYFFGQKLYSFE
ncbi:hypothetical protein HMPREF9446_03412 [Bacteroides fluxus YIT 12057]|uniref:Uncharacterized protein n=1 Tax=Bacteroides fluxus YIT 12057 TaxID=763034 RepID=F3PXC0_9BACE|nr:hypothetical protein HMPREF9446_03412 [Bacteroides fluxus YIT 12057]